MEENTKTLNREAQLADLLAKVRRNPNSPKVQAWKREIAELRKHVTPAKVNHHEAKRAPVASPAFSHNFDYKAFEHSEAQALEGSSDPAVLNCIACAVYPDSNQHRPCDSTTQPTNLLRSVSEYVVSVNFDGTEKSGFFSLATQPCLGSLQDANKQYIGIVDTSSGWPTDFTTTNSYVTSANGMSPKYDFYLNKLLGQNNGTYSRARTFTNYNVAAGVIVDGFMFRPGAGAPSTGTNDLSNLSVQTQNLATGSFSGLVTVTIDNPVAYTVPSGTYEINVALYIEPFTPVANEAFRIYAIDSNNQIVGVLGWDNNTTVPNISSGYFQGRVQPQFNHNSVAVVNNANAVAYTCSFTYLHDPVVRLLPTTVFFGGAIVYTNLQSFISINVAVDSKLLSPNDSGTVSTLRPIAHSVLLTNLLPEILAGGNVVAYSAPSGDIRSIYYTQGLTIQPQEWFQLATLNKGNLMHDGPVKDGAYAFTQQWNDNDMLLRTPSEVNNYSYPGIMMSGVVIPPNGYSGIIAAFRLRVITIWEYVTDYPIFVPKALIGDASRWGHVMSILSKMQHAMPNNKHRRYLEKIFDEFHKGSRKKDKSNWLSDMLQAAGGFMSFLL